MRDSGTFHLLIYYVSDFVKQSLHHTRGITAKRVTSGGVHLRSLAPGKHISLFIYLEIWKNTEIYKRKNYTDEKN